MYPAGAAANSRQHDGTTRARRSGPSSDPAGSRSRPPRGFKGGLPRPQAPPSLPTPPATTGRAGRNALAYENLAPAGSMRAGIWNRPSTVAYQFHAGGGEDLEAVGVRRGGLPCRAARGLAMASRGLVTGKGMSWVLLRTYFRNGRSGAESSIPSMSGGARPRGRPTRLRDRREGHLRRSTAPDAGTDAARASCALAEGHGSRPSQSTGCQASGARRGSSGDRS